MPLHGIYRVKNDHCKSIILSLTTDWSTVLGFLFVETVVALSLLFHLIDSILLADDSLLLYSLNCLQPVLLPYLPSNWLNLAINCPICLPVNSSRLTFDAVCWFTIVLFGSQSVLLVIVSSVHCYVLSVQWTHSNHFVIESSDYFISQLFKHH